MTRDLTAVATTNSARRRAEAEDAVDGDSSGRLRRFRGFAVASEFSTNAFASKITAYDDAGEVVDTRRFCIHRAKGDVAAGLGKFAAGSWVPRREAFEDLWDHGRQFVYGAVNAGGLGTVEYGEFCLVEGDPSSRTPAVLAVFPGDSAQRYTTPPAVVDEAQAAEEATRWNQRADLVTVARASEVGPDESSWPRLVCEEGRYFEVVVVPGPVISGITEVRVAAGYVERLDELQARSLSGDPLTDGERTEAAAYDVIQSWRRSGTTIREVD